jgi:hypothetical protein
MQTKYTEKFTQNIVKAMKEKEKLEIEIEHLQREVLIMEKNDKLITSNLIVENKIRENVKKLSSIKATILFNESLLDHLNKNLKEFRSLTLQKMYYLLNGSFQERLEGKEALEYLTNLNPNLKLYQLENFEK